MPPVRAIFNPTNTEVAQLSNRSINDARWVLFHSTRRGATKNHAAALSSRNDMISIHQRSARTNEGKTTLIKSYSRTVSWMVSSCSASCSWRPLTGEFVTVIWRLHCFTASFRGDVRGESGPRELGTVNWRTPQWARGQFTWIIISDWFEKWRDIKLWCMC